MTSTPRHRGGLTARPNSDRQRANPFSDRPRGDARSGVEPRSQGRPLSFVKLRVHLVSRLDRGASACETIATMAARGSILMRRVVTPETWRSVELPPADGRESIRCGPERTRRMNQSVSLWNTRHKKRAIAIACSFLLVLPSCIPHLRDPMPGPSLPESFNGAASPENSSQLTIEDFFNDPTLTGLIHQAVFGNLE